MRERQGFLKHVALLSQRCGCGLALLLGLLALLTVPSRSTVQHEGARHASLAYAGQEAAKAWYFLHLDAGQAWQTTVTLANLEAQPVQVTLSAYDQAGGFLGELPAISSLEAEATQTIEAETMLSPGSETLKLEASGNLVGATIFKTLDRTKAEALPALQDASQQLDFPPLLQGDLDHKTISLLNIDSASANLEVIALDALGAELARTLLPPLSPMASHTFAVQDLFSAEILQQLSAVRVISDRGIVGLQLVDPPHGDLVGLPALTSTSQAWSFPIVIKGGAVELWTAVGLFNPGKVSTSVTVEAFDVSNNSLGIIDGATLLPGATHFALTANMGAIIPSNAASLKVASDQPITGYEVIGVVNGNGLTAALGTPGEDQTAAGLEITGSKDGSVLNAYPMMRMRDGSVQSALGGVPEGFWKERVRQPQVGHAQTLSGGNQLSLAKESITAQQTTSTCQVAVGFSPPLRGGRWVLTQEFASYLATYGGRTYNGYHGGEDWDLSGSSNGKPVYAIGPGRIAKMSDFGKLGYLVAIEHTGSFMIPGKSGTSNGKSYTYPTENVTRIYSVYVHISPRPGLTPDQCIGHGEQVGTITKQIVKKTQETQERGVMSLIYILKSDILSKIKHILMIGPS